jgi:MFS superfamily sulfate permease-like transporter
VGLCTAVVAPIVYAALGRSSVLSVTSTATLGILAGSALADAVPGADPARLAAAAATLTVLVGAALLLAAALRFGFVANFISEPVLAGFKAGIGAVIIADQLPKLFGFHVQKVGFFRDLLAILRSLGETSIPTLGVSAAAVGGILAIRRWLPRLPAALVAVVLGIAASALLSLAAHGVPTVGPIRGGLPSLVLPELGLVEALWPTALAIALMSFTESIAAGRAFAGRGEPRPSANQELVATGLGNALGGLLGAMPSGGGTSQTLVNQRAGARTQLAGLVLALTALATLLVLAPAVSYLPQAVLAAIVVVYSVELLSPKDFRAILAIRRLEFVWALVALAGVLVLGTLRGIVVAVITSMVALAQQASVPEVYEVARIPGTNVFRRRSGENPEDEAWPGLLLVRIEGRIFFGNTEHVIDSVAPMVQAASPEVLVLDCSAIFDIEYSGLKMLAEAEERARDRGGELWLAALNPRTRRGVERSPLGRRLGEGRMLLDLEHAVAEFRARQGRSGGRAGAGG